VCKTRGRLTGAPRFGEYYLLDCDRNHIADENVDLEKLSRELDCLRPWEQMGL
jgi:hypothetical protein